MSILLLPTSRKGKYAVLLLLLYFLPFVIVSIILSVYGLGYREHYGLTSQLPGRLWVLMLIIGGYSVAAFFTAIISIIIRKERAVLVFIVVAWSLFWLFLIAFSMISPFLFKERPGYNRSPGCYFPTVITEFMDRLKHLPLIGDSVRILYPVNPGCYTYIMEVLYAD